MSSEQLTLSDVAPQRPSPQWTPVRDDDADEHHCRGCGAHVSADYARVSGDNDDVVHACLRCSTKEDLRDGAAAGGHGRAKL